MLGRGELLGVLGLLTNSLVERSQLTLALTDALVTLTQLLTEVIDMGLMLSTRVAKLVELPLGLGDQYFTLVHLVRQTFDLTIVLVPGLVDRRQLLLQFLEALVASGQFLGELLNLSFGAVIRVA